MPARRLFDTRMTDGSIRAFARAVDGYGQFCPIALGAEIFAQRWTPLILREH